MSVEYNKGTQSIIIDGRIIKELDSISRQELKQIQNKLSEYEKRRDSSKNPDYWQKKIDLLESSANTLTLPEINNWENELEEPPPLPTIEVDEEITELFGQKSSPRGTISYEERALENMYRDYEIGVDDVPDLTSPFNIYELDAKIEELDIKQYENYLKGSTEEEYETQEEKSKYQRDRKKILNAMSIKERSAYDYNKKRSVHMLTQDEIKRAKNLAKELEEHEGSMPEETMFNWTDGSLHYDYDDSFGQIHFDNILHKAEVEGLGDEWVDKALEELDKYEKFNKKRDAIIYELDRVQGSLWGQKEDREKEILKSIDSILYEGLSDSQRWWADKDDPISVETGRSIHNPETRETKPELRNLNITDIIKDIEAKESTFNPGLESLGTYSDGGTINKGNNNMTEDEYKAKMESGGYRHETGTPIINDLLSLVIGEENIPDKILSGTGEFIGESATGLGEYIQGERQRPENFLPSLLSFIKMLYDKYNKPSSNAHQNIDSLLQDENIKNILPMLMNAIKTMTGIGTGPQLPDMQREAYDTSLQGAMQGMQRQGMPRKKLDPKIKTILQSHVDSLIKSRDQGFSPPWLEKWTNPKGLNIVEDKGFMKQSKEDSIFQESMSKKLGLPEGHLVNIGRGPLKIR